MTEKATTLAAPIREAAQEAAQHDATMPAARGTISAVIVDALRGQPHALALPAELQAADPFGEDVQLALHICYELHYRGFAGVDPEWEWESTLLGLRAELERLFLAAMRAQVAGGVDAAGELDALLVEPVPGHGLSHFLRDEAQWWQLREFFVHRSIYHLKEADPHAWVIPRLSGRPKAALVAVEFDEFGGGRAERVHAQLFADLLVGAGLSADYLYYVEHVPACALAPVNMMSLFGLHRRWRAALVGHFTAAEITTGPSAQRIDDALAGLGAAPAVPAVLHRAHRGRRRARAGDASRGRGWAVGPGPGIGRRHRVRYPGDRSAGASTHRARPWSLGSRAILATTSAMRSRVCPHRTGRDGPFCGGWCRTTGSVCCAGRRRSPP